MTTAREMIPALGAHVFVRFQDLTFECWVKDVKNSYGKPRLLIVPVTGSGEQWVELGRVTVPASVAADTLARQPAGATAIDDSIGRSAAEEIASMRRSIQSILR
jgi:hypothetical protein